MATKNNKKSNAQKIIITGGLFGVAFWLYSKYNTLDKLEYDIDSVKFDRIKNITEALILKLKVRLAINNPTSSALSFTSFVGNVISNGASIGKFQIFQPVRIKPNGKTFIEFPVQIDSVETLGLVFQAVKGNIKKSVIVKGLLKIGSININVNQEIPITNE